MADELIGRAIAFYDGCPDGQYDSDVVEWLTELLRLRAEIERLRELLSIALVEHHSCFGRYTLETHWTAKARAALSAGDSHA